MLRTVPTIEKLLADFLSEERERLADATFRKYEDAVSFFRLFLDGYGHQYLSQEEREWMAARPDRTFTESFGAGHVLHNFDEFLGWFIPRKTMAGKGMIRASGTVLKRLAKWLGERGLAEEEAVRDAVARAAGAVVEQVEAEDLAERLIELADPFHRFAETVEDRFEFVRVEGRDVWIEDLGGAGYGPIRLPADVAARCRAGWFFSGEIGRVGKRWALADVWSVTPGP